MKTRKPLRMMLAAALMFAPLHAAFAEDTEKKKDDAKPAAKGAETITAEDVAAEKKDKVAPIALETDEDKFSYMIGADVGTNLKQNGIPVVRERFLMGFNDIFQGKEPAMTDEEMKGVIEQYQKLMGPRQPSPDGTPTPVKPVEGDEAYLGQLSYVVGADVATNLKRNSLKMNEEPFIRAIEDVANERKLALTDEEMKQVFEAYRGKQMEKAKAAGEKNLADGVAFLAENGKKEGVKSTASGLQYTVITEGKGDMPTAADTVKTHYRGTFLDGTEFDSSYARNEPTTFPVGGVIRGWTEALQLMHVGDKWKLFIPSELAYGEHGFPPDIAPNMTLQFDIELLEIMKAGKPEEPASDGTIKLNPETTGKKSN